MNKVYSYKDYRKYLKDAIQSRKKATQSINFSRIAEDIGIQRSYLSQVLNDKGNLNSDQLYLIGKKLRLEKKEIEYLLLILEIDKCVLPERKAELIASRNRIQNRELTSNSVLNREPLSLDTESFSKYYNDPYAHSFICTYSSQVIEETHREFVTSWGFQQRNWKK